MRYDIVHQQVHLKHLTMQLKKTILLSALFILILSSCNKRPLADFTMDDETPEPNQVIHFTSTSLDGHSYEWNFGDGGTSTAENPAHIFTEAGSYFIELTVHNKKDKKSDTHSKYIEVKDNTLGMITHLWNYDTAASESYTNGVLTSTFEFDLDDFYTIHTVEFKSDFTYETTLDAEVSVGPWSYNSAGHFLIIDSDTSNISSITNNSFNLVSYSSSTDGINVYSDSTRILMTR